MISCASQALLNQTAEYRLIRHLFGSYNFSMVRPVINSTDPVEVQFQMKLSRLVKVVSNLKAVTLHSSIYLIQWRHPPLLIISTMRFFCAKRISLVSSQPVQQVQFRTAYFALQDSYSKLLRQEETTAWENLFYTTTLYSLTTRFQFLIWKRGKRTIISECFLLLFGKKGCFYLGNHPSDRLNTRGTFLSDRRIIFQNGSQPLLWWHDSINLHM